MDEDSTPTSSNQTRKDLSEETLEILQSRGNDTTLTSGARSIINTTYTSADSVESEASVEIPDELDSIETLHFFEFAPGVAVIIWGRHILRCHNEPDRASVLDEARRWVKGFKDVWGANADWFGAMDTLGLTKSCQLRLMDLNFEYMRLRSSLNETVLDMIQMKYEFLSSLDSVIKHPISHSVGRSSSQLNADGTFSTTPAPEPSFEDRGVSPS